MRNAVHVTGCTFTLVVVLLTAASTSAAPIMLHDTGEGLVPGDLDPNWTVELPDGTAFGQAISATDPNGAWIAPTPPSTWISIAASDFIPIGTYRYSTTFEIGPGMDPSSASVSGFWWSDDPNPANGIYLNGAQVSTFQGAFWFDTNLANAAFSIASDFVAGTNVLTFDVTNTGGPGGTLVQGLAGSVKPIPEPLTLLLLGSSLVGVAASRRWRRR